MVSNGIAGTTRKPPGANRERAENGAMGKSDDVVVTLTDRTPPIPGTYEPRAFTYADVASRFRVSVVTVKRWVGAGMIPSPNYIGSTARWTPEQIDEMGQGPKAKGSYPRGASPRAGIAKKAAKAKAKAKRSTKRGAKK